MKKAVISCIIALVLIVVGIVLTLVKGAGLSTDFTKGTQIDVKFNTTVTDDVYEDYASKLVKAVEGAGYNVSEVRALRNVKQISGVRIVFSGVLNNAQLTLPDVTEGMTYTVSTIYPTSTQSIWTIVWVLVISVAIMFVYTAVENRKRKPLLCAFTVLIVTILGIALTVGLYLIVSALFALEISVYTLCGIALAAVLCGMASISSVREVKNSGCSCKWLIPAGIVGIIGMVILGVFGFTAFMAAGIAAVLSAVFTALCITTPFVKNGTENK